MRSNETKFFVAFDDANGERCETLPLWRSYEAAETWLKTELPKRVPSARNAEVMRRTVLVEPASAPARGRSLTYWLGRFYQSKFRIAAAQSSYFAADLRLRKQGIPATARKITLGK